MYHLKSRSLQRKDVTLLYLGIHTYNNYINVIRLNKQEKINCIDANILFLTSLINNLFIFIQDKERMIQ